MTAANQSAIGSVVPIWGVTAGGIGVTSVFGRAGVVVAVAGDYDSSQVTNVSTVAGATVSDALEALLPLAGGTLTGKVGQTPAAFAFNANLSIDVSTRNLFQQSDTMTGDIALTLANGVDGDQGIVAFVQDGVGGRKITSCTVAGRTVSMQAGIATINTAEFLVPGAIGLFSYQYVTVNGVARCVIGMTADQAASFA